jgi:hypothetical protein
MLLFSMHLPYHNFIGTFPDLFQLLRLFYEHRMLASRHMFSVLLFVRVCCCWSCRHASCLV